MTWNMNILMGMMMLFFGGKKQVPLTFLSLSF